MVVLSTLEKSAQSIWYLIFEKVNNMEYAATCKPVLCWKPHIPGSTVLLEHSCLLPEATEVRVWKRHFSCYFSFLFAYLFFHLFWRNTRMLLYWTMIYISSKKRKHFWYFLHVVWLQSPASRFPAVSTCVTTLLISFSMLLFPLSGKSFEGKQINTYFFFLHWVIWMYSAKQQPFVNPVEY